MEDANPAAIIGKYHNLILSHPIPDKPDFVDVECNNADFEASRAFPFKLLMVQNLLFNLPFFLWGLYAVSHGNPCAGAVILLGTGIYMLNSCLLPTVASKVADLFGIKRYAKMRERILTEKISELCEYRKGLAIHEKILHKAKHETIAIMEGFNARNHSKYAKLTDTGFWVKDETGRVLPLAEELETPERSRVMVDDRQMAGARG